MDRIDKHILSLLQEDCELAVAEIGQRVGLSTSPCWRRIQRLEQQGFVKKRVALLDPDLINLSLTAFVTVKTNQHSVRWLEVFTEAVTELPEVVEVYRMSGEVDYLLKIVAPDINAYDRVYKKLISRIEIMDVSSSFVMEVLKSTTALPLSYA
ncbi:MAG: Lrp/AsnC family transcriptional regulator [Pseudomonadales bacterium]|nr:Lrp/AsnC family transcriptional regulator [Pseudomonadales bacterium]